MRKIKMYFPIIGIIISIMVILIFHGDVFTESKNEPGPDVDRVSLLDKEFLHPDIPLLDNNNENVITSGGLISTRNTCGGCHNYHVITDSFHAQQGRDEMDKKTLKEHDFPPYVMSTGMYGKWCTMPMRQLSPKGLKNPNDFDMGTPEWTKTCGTCHPGGGPSEYDQQGRRLDTVDPATVPFMHPDYSILKNGKVEKWDWRESGVMEMNCFLCHTPDFSRVERDTALRKGKFGEANTASLLPSKIVLRNEEGKLVYNPDAFDENGNVKMKMLKLQDPAAPNCGQCHGFTGNENEKIYPFLSKNVLRGTMKMGRIWKGSLVSKTKLNIADKEKKEYAWDVHAAKGIECIDCHFAINNPAKMIRNPKKMLHNPRISKYFSPYTKKILERLKKEEKEYLLDYLPVGRNELSHYLKNPDHNFAKGKSCPESVSDVLDYTMRRCIDCHNTSKTHEWLPYKDYHMSRVGCETCHIPKKDFWAFQTGDWSVPSLVGKQRPVPRGIKGTMKDIKKGKDVEITGFIPAFMERTEDNGEKHIMPYNLITVIYWYDKAEKRPLYRHQLLKTFTKKGADGKLKYTAETIAFLDSNKNGKLEGPEIKINTEERLKKAKEMLIRIGGAKEPVLHVEVVPFSINHNILTGEQALKDCSSCHSERSHLLTPIRLTNYIPAEGEPELLPYCAQEHNVEQKGLTYEHDGMFYYNPKKGLEGYYFIGQTRNDFAEILGWLSIVFALLGVVFHGGIRLLRSSRKKEEE